jgi:SecD/SecF fusion protein
LPHFLLPIPILPLVSVRGFKLVLIAIFIFGGESIRGFMFALIIGVLVGTYSSVFIATPIMFDSYNKKN